MTASTPPGPPPAGGPGPRVPVPPPGARVAGARAADPPPSGFLGTLKSALSQLPTLTAGSGLLLGILALVGVTTDTLPEVALNAPFALAFGVGVPLLLLIGSVAFAAGREARGWALARRGLAVTVFALSLLFLVVAATNVSTQSTTPVVGVALTALPGQARAGDTEGVHYAYRATVEVDRIQADERVRIWAWVSERPECARAGQPPRRGNPTVVHESATGADADGSLGRELEGHVVLEGDEGLCVVARSPGRCGGEGTLEYVPFVECLDERPERAAFAFAHPDPPPEPTAAAGTATGTASPTSSAPGG